MAQTLNMTEGRVSLVRQRTAAFALSALMLYPLGILLPVVALERFGHRQETSILGGIAELMSSGHLVLAAIVLICSICLPLFKLGGLLVLSSERIPLGARGRDRVWRLLEITGRWGMLDVLLVAALVAAGGVLDDAWVSSFPAGLADPLAAEASAGDWSRDLARKRRAAALVGACHLACGHFAALAVEGDCCPEGVVDVVRLLGAREPLGEALGARAWGYDLC